MTKKYRLMESISVKFNKTFGYIFLVSGIVLLLAQVALYSITKASLSIIPMTTSILIIVAGVRYLRGVYFKLTSSEIVLYNLFGSAVKKHSFNSTDDIDLIDDKFYLEKDGKSKRIRLSKIMSDKKDWELFISELTKNDFTKELHEEY